MFEKLLTLLFPTPSSVAKLESLTPAALFSKAGRAPRSHETWIESIFSYKDPLVHDLIWQLKFHRNTKVAKLFADTLTDHIAETISDTELFSRKQAVLIPIPSSKKRMKEKGFNQTFLVCDYLGTIPIRKDILIRTKHTPPQSRIKDKTERLKNSKNCFAVKKNADLVNKHIILFDDVTTTGATLSEARKTLLSSGAKNVTAITIAH